MDDKSVKKIDFNLILAVVLLAIFGLIVHYSLSIKTDSLSFYMQLIWFVMGLGVMGTIASVSFHQLKHFVIPIYAINTFLLAVVLLIGLSAGGASRWLQLGPIHIQPSEFTKLVLIIALASFLADRKGILSSKDIYKSFLLIVLPALLVFLQPDLGTAIVIIVIWLGVLVVAGVKPIHLFTIILIGVLILGVGIKTGVLKQYQINRLLVFINPNLDLKETGYSLLQSKIAIGSGGFLGKGLFSGTQTNLSFIPAANTDFIFSVIGEKLGFLGALVLVVFFFILLSRTVYIALAADNYYGSLLALAIGAMWLFQVFVNIGMTIGIMPITGIPLPFISYGGSALLTNMTAAGILLNIYSRSIK